MVEQFPIIQFQKERAPDWYKETAWYKNVVENTGFREWFSGSAVVARGGAPLPVFHYSPREFDAFDIRFADLGLHFGSVATTDDRAAKIRKHNELPEESSQSERVFPVFLNIKHPFRVDDLLFFSAPQSMEKIRRELAKSACEKFIVSVRKKLDLRMNYSLASMEQVRSALRGKGYDGLIYQNKYEGGGDSYMALDETQVWYALSNEQAQKPNYSEHKVKLEPGYSMNFDQQELDHE